MSYEKKLKEVIENAAENNMGPVEVIMYLMDYMTTEEVDDFLNDWWEAVEEEKKAAEFTKEEDTTDYHLKKIREDNLK